MGSEDQAGEAQEEEVKKARCGNCGHDKVRVSFDQDDGEAPFVRAVELTCTECKSRTVIKLYWERPKMSVNFHPDESKTDLGIFTVFQGDES